MKTDGKHQKNSMSPQPKPTVGKESYKRANPLNPNLNQVNQVSLQSKVGVV